MARLRILLVAFLAILVNFCPICQYLAANSVSESTREAHQMEIPPNWQPDNNLTLRNRFMGAVKVFAAKLHHRFHGNQTISSGREDEVEFNYVFNPAEISSLLGLIMYASRNDTTRNQLHELLGFRNMKMKPDDIFSAIQQYLYHERMDELYLPDRKVHLSHGIFINRSFPLHETFKYISKIMFQATTFKDLSNMDNVAKNKELQNYIANKSKNLISEVDRVNFRNFDVMIIGSTSFSGIWGPDVVKSPVDSQWFYCENGKQKIKMKKCEKEIWTKYVDKGDRFGVYIPVSGGLQGIYFFVPNSAELFKSLDVDMNLTFWENIREEMRTSELTPIKITFPLFQMSYSRDIKYDMRVLHVSSIFSEDAVIYENMTPEDNLYIDDVFHKSFITLSEMKLNFVSITYLTVVKGRNFARNGRFVSTPEAGPTTVPSALTTAFNKLMNGPTVETLEPEISSVGRLPIKQLITTRSNKNKLRAKPSPNSKSKCPCSQIRKGNMVSSLNDLLTSVTRQPGNHHTVLSIPQRLDPEAGPTTIPSASTTVLSTPQRLAKTRTQGPKFKVQPFRPTPNYLIPDSMIKHIHIDKSFFFAIVSRESGVILAIGKVYKCPEESRNA